MTDPELPLIIVNPKSGRGISQQKWASCAAAIGENFGPFQCRFTEGKGDASRIAEEEAAAGRKLIVAMGGDGTISEVANGILRSQSNVAELGILPAGTGSDFRKSLEIPSNLRDASRKLKHAASKTMDAGKLEYVSHEGVREQRFFINTASFGMSGRVADRANRSAKILGGVVTYAAATLRSLVSLTYPEVRLQVDGGQPYRLKIVTVAVANGPSFGGGMKIATNAKLDDGFFDVTIIGDLRTSQILLHSYRLYSGALKGINKVAVMRSRRLIAEPVNAQGSPILLEVDGETPGRLPATFEILPAALRIRV
jgi:YegS/Rv2252/BmrU family lipid kinase